MSADKRIPARRIPLGWSAIAALLRRKRVRIEILAAADLEAYLGASRQSVSTPGHRKAASDLPSAFTFGGHRDPR